MRQWLWFLGWIFCFSPAFGWELVVSPDKQVSDLIRIRPSAQLALNWRGGYALSEKDGQKWVFYKTKYSLDSWSLVTVPQLTYAGLDRFSWHQDRQDYFIFGSEFGSQRVYPDQDLNAHLMNLPIKTGFSSLYFEPEAANRLYILTKSELYQVQVDDRMYRGQSKALPRPVWQRLNWTGEPITASFADVRGRKWVFSVPVSDQNIPFSVWSIEGEGNVTNHRVFGADPDSQVWMKQPLLVGRYAVDPDSGFQMFSESSLFLYSNNYGRIFHYRSRIETQDGRRIWPIHVSVVDKNNIFFLGSEVLISDEEVASPYPSFDALNQQGRDWYKAGWLVMTESEKMGFYLRVLRETWPTMNRKEISKIINPKPREKKVALYRMSGPESKAVHIDWIPTEVSSPNQAKLVAAKTGALFLVKDGVWRLPIKKK